jgi:hypothetical protein
VTYQRHKIKSTLLAGKKLMESAKIHLLLSYHKLSNCSDLSSIQATKSLAVGYQKKMPTTGRDIFFGIDGLAFQFAGFLQEIYRWP